MAPSVKTFFMNKHQTGQVRMETLRKVKAANYKELRLSEGQT